MTKYVAVMAPRMAADANIVRSAIRARSGADCRLKAGMRGNLLMGCGYLRKCGTFSWRAVLRAGLVGPKPVGGLVLSL